MSELIASNESEELNLRHADEPRRAAPRPARIAIDRSFWMWVFGGALATIVVGVVYAHYLQRTYGWLHGHAWEIALLRDTHTRLPTLVDELVLVLPWFGTNITILPGIAIASYILAKRKRRDLITVLVVAAAGNYLIAFFLKYALNRPRPTLFLARGEYTGPSYPSGHAMLATSVLFVVAYLLRRERNWRWPYYVVFIFGLLTVYSRLYLGVHWPSDVLAGAVLGLLWLTAMLRAMDARSEELITFGRRRSVGETPTEPVTA
ncbi:MAG TPA: phosphatase PAP2 family protein [Gemmatimonadaceae bacterium]